MGWPDLESCIPAPLRGGPVPPDVRGGALAQLRESWRRYVARRVHGAKERAIALVVLPSAALPFALVLDEHAMECAAPVDSGEEAVRAVEGLPRSGMIMRQGGVVLWRESLTEDRVAARWRELAGDLAFTLPPSRLSGRPVLQGVQAYAIVRRGGDQARIDFGSGLELPAETRSWLARFASYLPTSLRGVLAPPS